MNKEEILLFLKNNKRFIKSNDNLGWYTSYHCIFCNIKGDYLETKQDGSCGVGVGNKYDSLLLQKNHEKDCPMREVLNNQKY